VSARRRILAAFGLLFLMVIVAGLPPRAGARAQEARQTSVKPDAAAAGIENPAASRPVRERMAVDVIVGWVWISIAVLLWILRLRIREADRVSRMGLVQPADKSYQEKT
jgi:hypothetical protein